MDTSNIVDRDQLMQLLGAQAERIQNLENKLAKQLQDWEPAVRQWERLIRDRQELAEWLVDQATDQYGRVIRPLIDAALGGDPFVPGSLKWSAHGKEYRLRLESTEYQVEVTKAAGSPD